MVIVSAVFIIAIKYGAHYRQKNYTPRKTELNFRNREICLLTFLIFYRISLTCFCCGATLFNENRNLHDFPSPSSSLTPGFDVRESPAASQTNILSMATASIAFGEAGDSLYILRNNLGDTFFDIDHSRSSCSLEKCSHRSSGTATVALELNNISDGRKLFFDKHSNNDRLCYCRCLQNTPTFREDLHVCVNDIHECPLVSFASGATQQKIPYVFLPMKGQIIYPNAEIKFHGLNSVPTCIISGVRYLSRSGWVDVKNSSMAEYHHEYSAPFRLFYDKHRTFLQWLGNAELRAGMEGRLVLIDLICKDSDSQLLFTPCISFRVAGVPNSSHFSFNHVQDSSASLEKEKKISSNEYVALGLAALLIGLIYVISVFLYLRFKKNKLQECSSRWNNTFKTFVDLEENISHPFGDAIGQSKQLIVEEEGLIKNNPLLMKRYHSPTAQIHKSSISAADESNKVNSGHTGNGLISPVDKAHIYSPLVEIASNRTGITAGIIYNKPFDALEQGRSLFRNRLTTPFNTCSKLEDTSNQGAGQTSVDSNNIQEKHPDENISIVERPEDIIQANFKHKLYFNPAYLEPELLMAPPPAAVEFLLKIREIMTIAKRKISSKRFSPSLSEIPEENLTEELEKAAPAMAKPIVQSFSKYEAIEPTMPKLVAPTSESADKNKNQIIKKWLQGLPKTCSTAEESKSKPPSRVTSTRPEALPVSIFEQCNTSKILQTFCPPSVQKQKTPEVPIRSKRLQQALVAEITARENLQSVTKDKVDAHCYQTTATVECKDAETEEPTASAGTATFNSSLPLDEELTMQNTIFNVVTGNTTLSKLKLRYERGDEGDKDSTSDPDQLSAEHIKECYSLVSEVYVNDGFSSSSCSRSSSGASSLHSSTNSLVEQVAASEQAAPTQPSNNQESTRLMIQLRDCPFFYSVESADDFEPDTLDRKPSRGINTNSSSRSLYSKFMDSLERPAICLRTHGSFRNDSTIGRQTGELTRSFGSLQEIYQQRRKKDLAKSAAVNRQSIPIRDENAPQSLSPQVELLLRKKDTAQPRHYYRQRKLSPPPPLPLQNSSQHQFKPPLPPRKSETRNGNFRAQSFCSGGRATSKTTPSSCLSSVQWSNRPEDSGYLSSSESEKSQKLTAKIVANDCSQEMSSECMNVVEAAIEAKYSKNGILNGGYDDDDDDDDNSVSSYNDAYSESGAESIATNFEFFKNNS